MWHRHAEVLQSPRCWTRDVRRLWVVAAIWHWLARSAELAPVLTTQHREEPAMNITGSLVPLLNLLPTFVLETLSSRPGTDVAASNVRFSQGETCVYIAGAKVLRNYSLAPLPGMGMAVALLSTGGWCTITVRHDRAAVRDEKLFAQCLLEGFDEILALAGDPAPRVAPASFALGRDRDELLKKIPRAANLHGQPLFVRPRARDKWSHG
jgi:WS/DGAT C-terminal domain